MGKKADSRIKNFVEKVRKKFRIEKAILFGSRARGDFFKNSDYDIILVSPDFKGIFFTQRIANMYQFWSYFPINVEPLCYTPEEFEKKREQIGIIKQALKEGIEI